jgi:hypothetical protein
MPPAKFYPADHRPSARTTRTPQGSSAQVISPQAGHAGVCTKARTAGVISDSSSGGIVSEFGLADDIMHVVSENPPCVQVSFPKQCHRGVNGYPPDY